MDFNLTEDRRMVLDTLSRYLKDQYPVEHRINVAYDAPVTYTHLTLPTQA